LRLSCRVVGAWLRRAAVQCASTMLSSSEEERKAVSLVDKLALREIGPEAWQLFFNVDGILGEDSPGRYAARGNAPEQPHKRTCFRC
jgi:hypothetical protein